MKASKHKNDLVNLRAFGVTREKSPKWVTHPGHIYALGMHASFPRDKLRLQAMAIQTGASITTVSSHREGYAFKGVDHLCCTFSCDKGVKSLANRVQKKSNEFPKIVAAIVRLITNDLIVLSTLLAMITAFFLPMKITVILDYFWTQSNYYENDYGMAWLNPCLRHSLAIAPALLKAGATDLMLPVDCRQKSVDPSNMETMMVTADPCLRLELVEPEDNPLWLATNAVSKIEEQIGPLTPKTPWTHEIMMARLSREKPFVIVTMVQPCDPVLVQRVTQNKLVVLEMRLQGEDLNGMVRFAGVLRDGLNTQTKTGSIIANGGIKRFHIKVPPA